MKPVLLALLLLPMPNALFAQTKINKASAEQLMQMERDWSQADVKKDAAALNRILAEDWIGIDFQGTVLTKAEVLSQIDLHSDATATESTELGEMKIRIFGNTALVSGTEIEKSEYKGKDSSGKYVWTDVFVRRKGRWQAVSSQSTKLAAPEGPKLLARRPTTGGEGRERQTEDSEPDSTTATCPQTSSCTALSVPVCIIIGTVRGALSCPQTPATKRILYARPVYWPADRESPRHVPAETFPGPLHLDRSGSARDSRDQTGPLAENPHSPRISIHLS